MSKERRPPLSISKNGKPRQHTLLLNSGRKSEKSFEKNKTMLVRNNRLYTASDDKRLSKSKKANEHSISETKKNRKKSKIKANNKLALNLW